MKSGALKSLTPNIRTSKARESRHALGPGRACTRALAIVPLACLGAMRYGFWSDSAATAMACVCRTCHPCSGISSHRREQVRLAWSGRRAGVFPGRLGDLDRISALRSLGSPRLDLSLSADLRALHGPV